MKSEQRQKHDYGEMAAASRQTAEEALADARIFVAAIESYLRSTGDAIPVQEGGERSSPAGQVSGGQGGGDD